eukprot:m.332667 g.332667  ORF g.332667 m.332667 type:complete len:249 (+) comp16983_c0_seq1:232-978(+)
MDSYQALETAKTLPKTYWRGTKERIGPNEFVNLFECSGAQGSRRFATTEDLLSYFKRAGVPFRECVVCGMEVWAPRLGRHESVCKRNQKKMLVEEQKKLIQDGWTPVLTKKQQKQHQKQLRLQPKELKTQPKESIIWGHDVFDLPSSSATTSECNSETNLEACSSGSSSASSDESWVVGSQPMKDPVAPIVNANASTIADAPEEKLQEEQQQQQDDDEGEWIKVEKKERKEKKKSKGFKGVKGRNPRR